MVDITDLEQLFPALKGTRVSPEERAKEVPTPAKTMKMPDAVVMCHIVTTCKCGARYESPNPRIMLRYGRVSSRIKTWLNAYNYLPREMVVREEHAPTCTKCFHRQVWGFDELDRDGNMTQPQHIENQNGPEPDTDGPADEGLEHSDNPSPEGA